MLEQDQHQVRLKRPRKMKIQTAISVSDPIAYKENMCSLNARLIIDHTHQIDVSLWHDKHYQDRLQFGDLNGQRDGIDIEIVRPLILESVRHLLLYGSLIKNFHFLNRDTKNRIVCQKVKDSIMLNVAIEAHLCSYRKIEVTIFTAMCSDDFRVGDGQYMIELLGDDRSVLKKKEGGKIIEVSTI